MSGNATGGILLFTIGALIIAMGVTDKGKQIFSILTGDTAVIPSDTYPETGLGKGDSTIITPGNNMFGFNGVKGASVLNG